ncbi:MAG: biopolymer transporter ExbD [Planctomycetes bacterium]|nr:biopolymer transporter ExbD [Planctomycetota bacterium]
MEQLHTYEAPSESQAADTADHEPILARRRPIEEAEMDITPMIDITFLLLIFFLVASKIDTQGAVELPPAAYGKPVAVGDAVIITVREGGPDGSALVFLGDGSAEGKVKAENPADQEDEIAAYIDQMMAKEQKHFVLIKASKSVKHRDVARVANAVGRTEAAQTLHIAVLEES